MNLSLKRSPRAKGLPGPVLGLLYAAAAVSPLLLAMLSGNEPADVWSEAATATGMIGAVMLFLQLVSSGRFEALSGRIGIDVTMAFHKWFARVMVVVLLLHPLLFVAPVTPDRLGAALNHLAAMIVSPRYLSGVVALLLVVAIVLLALLRDRLPMPYEAWRASHGLLALAATWATVEHLLKVGTYSQERRIVGILAASGALRRAAALGVYTVRAWRMHHQTWRVVGKRRPRRRALADHRAAATTASGCPSEPDSSLGWRSRRVVSRCSTTRSRSRLALEKRMRVVVHHRGNRRFHARHRVGADWRCCRFGCAARKFHAGKHLIGRRRTGCRRRWRRSDPQPASQPCGERGSATGSPYLRGSQPGNTDQPL